MTDQFEMLALIDAGEEATGMSSIADKLRALIRKHIKPTVPDVLPLAIEYHREFPHGLYDFFHLRHCDDESIRQYTQGPLEKKGQQLVSLLLEMSPNGRGKVARRARGLVGLEQFEANRQRDTRPDLPWQTRTTMDPRAIPRTSMNVRSIRVTSESDGTSWTQDYRGASADEIIASLPDPMPTHIEVDGMLMPVVEVRASERFGPCVVVRHPSGYLRRISGRALAGVRFQI